MSVTDCSLKKTRTVNTFDDRTQKFRLLMLSGYFCHNRNLVRACPKAMNDVLMSSMMFGAAIYFMCDLRMPPRADHSFVTGGSCREQNG